MALDLVEERASMLGRTGSFWYRELSESDRSIARSMTQIGCMTKAVRQLSNASRAVLSGGYFTDNYVLVKFDDSKICYYGVDKALQHRYRTALGSAVALGRGKNLVIDDSEQLTEDGKTLAEHYRPVVVPGENGDIVLPTEYRAEYGLLVDSDMCVNAIVDAGNRVLLNGTDFMATYGYIAFTDNPVHTFPDMKFIAKSVIRRERNLLSYVLRLNNAYGPVDRVIDYYRNVQTPKSLNLAAAQACGMAVVRADSTVERVVPLHSGVSYIDTDGRRYDADYPHTRLRPGDSLENGRVIGAGDLFSIIAPGSGAEASVSGVYTGRSLPVPDLFIPNRTVRIGVVDGSGNRWFRPDYEGDGVQEYHEFLASMDGGPISPAGTGIEGNALNDFMSIRCPGRCLVCRIGYGTMPDGMLRDLLGFLDREAPIGSVLTYAPIGVNLPA